MVKNVKLKILGTRNTKGTLFLTFSLRFTLLLEEIDACPTILSGIHFQSVRPTLM